MIENGRKVCFVGGPEAGNVRIIPESMGEMFQGERDWIYQLVPFKLGGSNDIMYFAYAANEHPLLMLRDMWREYSPVAQIKRASDVTTYNKTSPHKT